MSRRRETEAERIARNREIADVLWLILVNAEHLFPDRDGTPGPVTNARREYFNKAAAAVLNDFDTSGAPARGFLLRDFGVAASDSTRTLDDGCC